MNSGIILKEIGHSDKRLVCVQTGNDRAHIHGQNFEIGRNHFRHFDSVW